MDVDVNNIISIKQLLHKSLNDDYSDYILNLINKTVENCNLLYTQVCYLIKLFLLYDYENNNGLYNDYNFNELFIRKCFMLIKTGTINGVTMNDNNNNDNNDNNDIINRIYRFYNLYNLNNNNQIKFIKPIDKASITHITDALSRDIQTNITNNIILNYSKYIKEYITINLKLEFKNIDTKIIYIIYNDIINNTCVAIDYKLWIDKHKKLIIPNLNSNIHIINFDDGIKNNTLLFTTFLIKHVKNNQNIKKYIMLKNDDINKTIKYITNHLIDDKFTIDNKYNNLINDIKNDVVTGFNTSNPIDLEKELEKNPYKFIPYMLFMSKNLELNKSNKKYQIIPLRTNLTPKFIPIGIDSFVDILDSKYLLNNIKNYYHNDNKNGLILFDTYFKFDSKYIKNTIKKGYEFSGLIYTNGHEINYIFNSKTQQNNKIEFHKKGKEKIKQIKEKTKNLNEIDKQKYIDELNIKKEQEKKEKLKLFSEKNKLKKRNEKENLDKILKNIETELNNLKKNYDDDLNKIEYEHNKNLKLKFGDDDVLNKIIINNELEKLNNDKIYLKHVYDRNYLSLVDDYNNNIDVKYNEIKKKEEINNNLIKKIKIDTTILKKEIKKLKKEYFNDINKKYKKEVSNINLKINNNKKNKKTLNRFIKKLKQKTELLNYETQHDLQLTENHVKKIIKLLSVLLLKIVNLNILSSLDVYLKNYYNSKLTNINLKINSLNDYFIKNKFEIKSIINMCLKHISIDVSNNNISSLESNISNKISNITILIRNMINKTDSISYKKDDAYKIKYNKIIKELNINTLSLNKLMNEKRKIEKEMINIFKIKSNEIPKIDMMSKKTLSILDKMNWVVIDPGINSLLTIMSKNGDKMTYSKCNYLNTTKRKETLKKIEKIKKEKINKIENKLTKETQRQKTSSNYKIFNDYFQIKMKIHNEIVKLYNDPKLNKLKWHSFINEKRSEKMLVNKIKSKFGNDVVLIMGDWSMNKKGIKSISTPNKKYETLLNKNFTMIKINEFRTSIIENKSEIKCENLKIKINYEKMNIKSVNTLERIKINNINKYDIITNQKIHKILTCKTSEKSMKYINRDINAVKNMVKIVSSYIKNNIKPKIFVLGTKICNNAKNII